MNATSGNVAVSIPTRLMQIAFGITTAYIVIRGGFYLLQDRIVYATSTNGHQSPKHNQKYFKHPSERGLNCEDVEILTVDCVILRGWFIKQDNYQNKPTVVFFHESEGNLGMRLDYFAYYFDSVGCNILVIAYRGYSDSEGTPSEAGIRTDAREIVKYVLNRPDLRYSRLIAHGRQLGGAVATFGIVFGNEGPSNRFQKLILENTFTSFEDLLKANQYKLYDFELRSKWETKNIIGGLNIPTLFVRTVKDQLVPDVQMQQLQQMVDPKLRTELVLKTGGHDDSWYRNDTLYFKTIREFISN